MTKKQRHSIYVDMLDIILSDDGYKKDGIYNTGLCDLLVECSGIIDYDFKNFPEIAKHKPKDHKPKGSNKIYYFWWDHKTKEGTDKRIAILKQAKKETANAINL